mgnify:FL=1|jgi:hypothetical protein|tara:strand:- start:928 stop:1224 length:297 start_codon:yes stop_codon:yes gene_type:complete
MNNLIDFLIQRLDPSTLLALLVAALGGAWWMDLTFLTKDESKYARNEMSSVIVDIRLTQLDQLPDLSPPQHREVRRLEIKQIRLDSDREEMEARGISP